MQSGKIEVRRGESNPQLPQLAPCDQVELPISDGSALEIKATEVTSRSFFRTGHEASTVGFEVHHALASTRTRICVGN